jgi:D-serine deaminase-like pyridoxal phosphate-dependent protein
MDNSWYQIANLDAIPSPAVAVYPERIRRNIRRAIEIARGPEHLRPHIKTHKCGEIVRMHLEEGVTKFKCSTLAEAEMAAKAGAPDVLIAYQLADPNLERLQSLRCKYPATRFAAICDNEQSARSLSESARQSSSPLPVFIDLNCGMGRTGIAPGDEAFGLYKLINGLPGLKLAGLHAYDGQIHDADYSTRAREYEQAFGPVLAFRKRLEEAGLIVPALVAGGTPTFPFHAAAGDRECSPGTYVFWDFGYQRYQELDFQIAALLITRVISKPAPNRLCLDLGYKAVASENPPPRVQFLNLPGAVPVMHNEEHLVLETPEASQWNIGDVLFGVPRHVCPSIALYDRVYPIVNGRAESPWPIEARQRNI